MLKSLFRVKVLCETLINVSCDFANDILSSQIFCAVSVYVCGKLTSFVELERSQILKGRCLFLFLI